MNEFNNAKKIYESVEIPSELDSVVRAAIEKSKTKKYRAKLLVYRVVPLVACAALCFVIGLKLVSVQKDEAANYVETQFGVEIAEAPKARNMPESAAYGSRTIVGDSVEEAQAVPASVYAPHIDNKISESIEECIVAEKDEKAYADMCEIYSDDMYFSYSITSYPSGKTKFYNIKQADGTEVYLDSFLSIAYVDEDEAKKDEFYIKNKNTLVFVKNGEEHEFVLD